MNTELNLAQFTGTQNYHKYSVVFPWLLLTDGVMYLANEAECFWLIDAIASYQPHKKVLQNPRLQEIQFWKLKVENESGILWVEEDKDQKVLSQEIPYTDFPLTEITLYVTKIKHAQYLCMLTSEY